MAPRALLLPVLALVAAGCAAHPNDSLRPPTAAAVAAKPPPSDKEKQALIKDLKDHKPPKHDQLAWAQAHAGPSFGPANLGDGCDRNYTNIDNACIPTVLRSSPSIGKPADALVDCAMLSNGNYLTGLAIVGTDDQVLDDNGDGVPCGPGDD